jgi:hypothetical protein
VQATEGCGFGTSGRHTLAPAPAAGLVPGPDAFPSPAALITRCPYMLYQAEIAAKKAAAKEKAVAEEAMAAKEKVSIV